MIEVPAVEVTEVMARCAGGAVLVDVREHDEWHAGHVEASLHLPMSELAARQDELPEASMLVVCRSGNRSAQVVAALLDAGYDALNVTGGLQSWVAAGLPLVDAGGAPGTVA